MARPAGYRDVVVQPALPPSDAPPPHAPRSHVPRGRGGVGWRLLRRTVAICFRYRVTGLAAEAAFFALLSLPPFILGLVGTLGYFTDLVGADNVARVRDAIVDVSGTFLSGRSVREVIIPTLDDVLEGGRFEIVSVGFLISLWSGSRALNVFVDTITIMYGLGGRRGILKTRALSFSLYLVGLGLAIVTLPLLLAGPRLIDALLPEGARWVSTLYWPVVVVLTVAFLTTLYHVSVPVRTPWWRDAPGALLALVFWVAGSVVLREVLAASVGGPSIYGPLAAPIVVLLWLYVTSLAVLIGAGLNAEVDEVWPARETDAARHEPPPHPEAQPTTPLRAEGEQPAGPDAHGAESQETPGRPASPASGPRVR
jgi:membrane protein